VQDDAGTVWRCFDYVADTHAAQLADRPAQAFEAARAFGEFQLLLCTLPAAELTEVIPGFHDTASRVRALESAAARDIAGRAADVTPELAFVRARLSLASDLQRRRDRGELPVRVVHNDAKISNVLFDDATGGALCVVDLDTVMPGLAAWDFGDLVRSMASAAAEDAPDPAQVTIRWEFLDAIVRGYLTGASFLSHAERASLVAGAVAITLEQGVRFLADYLEADRYYKVTHATQNLDRARVQFALLSQLESLAARLEHAVTSFTP
jgi:Ser/Thr protein kinase RdoA (MazF antagonist)